MRNELEAGQKEAAMRRAHSLKGAAGSLGATGIQEAAAALEQALRSDHKAASMTGLLDTLSAEQHALAEILALLPAAGGSVVDAVADPIHARAVLEQLEPLLTMDDTTANELLEANRTLLFTTYGSAAERLATQIESFEYPAALVALRGLMAPV
jgi:two-component system sensor histidine kinase/response regulator